MTGPLTILIVVGVAAGLYCVAELVGGLVDLCRIAWHFHQRRGR